MRIAQRLNNLEPYLFAEIDRKIAEKKAQGLRVIDFGIGDPDMPTPKHIVDALCEASKDPRNHRYPSYQGLPAFLEAVSSWFEKRFGVQLDPQKEIVSVIGSKDGISHFPLAFVNPGDTVLVTEPGYPVYRTSTIFAGGHPYLLPLKEERGYLPDLKSVPADVLNNATILFINYPNNPTTAVASLTFFEEAVYFARKHELIIAHDNAYSEITYDGYVAPSIMEVPGAKQVCVEFHSLSKTYNMTGWRLGFAVGGSEIIDAFKTLKTNIDSGVFNAIQYAGIAALTGPQDYVTAMCDIYKKRRDLLVECLEKIGWQVKKPQATIYVWVKVPKEFDSSTFTEYLLEESAIVVAPGSAYGPSGEGYVRFSLTIPEEDLLLGIDNLRKSFLQ